MVWTWESRNLRRALCSGYLRGSESCGNSRGGNHFPVAFLPAVGAVRADCSLSPLKVGALAEAHGVPAASGLSLLGGVLVAMWNYMGWDNASTIAGEVERPQRTYPKAMIAAVILVALSYVLPFAGVYLTGVPSSMFGGDGSWAAVAGAIGGKFLGFAWLRFLVILGGMMSAFGMFNALVMSYSRLPLAMAHDEMLPRFFDKVSVRTQSPWVAILFCAACWALCLGLGFKRLVTLDIVLYGISLMLEL